VRSGWARLVPSALLALAPLLHPVQGRAAPLTAPDVSALDRLCRATAREAPSHLAIEIAAGALREHQAFGGHVIDRTGRLLRFGATETDTGRPGSPTPWRQVLRYWESLGSVAANPLSVRREPGRIASPDASATPDNLPLSDLLERAGRGMAAPEREAVAQALMRAGMADVAWSAAFVSHVVIQADVATSRFTASPTHVDYVTEAAKRAVADVIGASSSSFYRACDPWRTRARAGDLLCLHRHPSEGLPSGAPLFAALIGAYAGGERRIVNLHCDIVTARDAGSRTMTVVGGNVLNSVAKRDLPLSRSGALAVGSRSAGACFEDREPGTLCRPEAGPWFVLLQAATDAR